MADCLNCKNCIREEVYDGQWGKFLFSRNCSVGVSVIIDGKLNPWNMKCDKFEHGEVKVIRMAEEEKCKYSTYYSNEKYEDNIITVLAEGKLNDLEKKAKELGIKLKKWNGKYKSTYQVLKELSNKWDKIQ